VVSEKPSLNDRLRRLARHALVFVLPVLFPLLSEALWRPVRTAHRDEFNRHLATGGPDLDAFLHATRWFYPLDSVLGFGVLIVPVALTGLIAAPLRRDDHFLSLVTTSWVSLFLALMHSVSRPPLRLGSATENLIASWIVCGVFGALIALALYLWRKSVYHRIHHWPTP
jgi:hypothetical protein